MWRWVRIVGAPDKGGAHSDAGNHGSSSTSNTGLAPVPRAVPVLPDAFSPRESEAKQVLDVLLSRDGAMGNGKAKALAHGMGAFTQRCAAVYTHRRDFHPRPRLVGSDFPRNKARHICCFAALITLIACY